MYIDESIYNEKNLEEEHRQTIRVIRELAETAIDNTIDSIESENQDNGSETLAKIENELARTVGERIKVRVESLLQEMIIGTIDAYSKERFEELQAEAAKRKEATQESAAPEEE